MGLHYTGELLAATMETKQGKNGSFEIREAVLFDGKTSMTIGMGRDFPTTDFLDLVKHADERPRVRLDLSTYNGRLYADGLSDFALPGAKPVGKPAAA